MPDIIDEVYLIDNVVDYWNLDSKLPLYPDNTHSFYRRYATLANWNSSEISSYNSTITRDSLDPSLDGEIILTAPTTGGNSGLTFTFPDPIIDGTTLLYFSAYGFASKVFALINGTIIKYIGSFPATLSGSTPVYSWQNFSIEVGDYPISTITIYINATNYVGAISSLTIGSGGTGYTSDDIGKVVSISGGTNGTALITSVSGGVVNGVSLNTSGYGYSNGTKTTSGSTNGSGLTLNITIVASPTGDYFKIDYLNIVSNSVYFNNNFTSSDGWSNATYSNGYLIQTNTTISKSFSSFLDKLLLRLYVSVVSGTNATITVNSITKPLIIDGSYNIIDFILPSTTTTVTISSSGNTLSYDFIYIGVGSFSTETHSSFKDNSDLVPIGVQDITGIFGNSYYFENAYAYTENNIPFTSNSLSIGFLFYIDKISTCTMMSFISPYSSSTVSGINLKIGLVSSGSNIFLTANFYDNNQVLQTLTGKINVSPHEWHYVAFTHTGTYATLYLDGTPDPLFTSTLYVPALSLSPMVLGADDTNKNNPFTGKLQEIRLYSYTATDSDILNQWNYYRTFISVPTQNYGGSVETVSTDGLVAYYICNDILPDPPDGNNSFIFNYMSYPYKLSNVPLIGNTLKTVKELNCSYFSQGDSVVGFNLPVSISSKNFFRMSIQYNNVGTRNIYIDFTHGLNTTTVSLLMNGTDDIVSVVEYINNFVDIITNIKVYMNDALLGDGFTVYWIYCGDGKDVSLLEDASGNNNASLVEVFSKNGSVYSSGFSSITTSNIYFQNDFSISFWINPSSLINQTLLTKNMPTGYSVKPLNLLLNSGDLTLSYSTSSSTTKTVATTTTPIDSSLHHIVITYSSSVLTIYVDSDIKATTIDYFVDAISSLLFIPTYTGYISNIRIYYRSLSKGEINYLFTNKR